MNDLETELEVLRLIKILCFTLVGVDAYEFYLPVAVLKLFLSFFLFWSNDLRPCLCFYYLICAKKLVFFRGAEKLVE